jgi:hypothetical protein
MNINIIRESPYTLNRFTIPLRPSAMDDRFSEWVLIRILFSAISVIETVIRAISEAISFDTTDPCDTFELTSPIPEDAPEMLVLIS